MSCYMTCNRRRRGGLVAQKTESDPNTWAFYSWKDHDLLSHQPHTILPYTLSFHAIFSKEAWNNSLCEKAYGKIWNITDLTFLGMYLKVARTMVSFTVTRSLCQSKCCNGNRIEQNMFTNWPFLKLSWWSSMKLYSQSTQSVPWF